MAKQAAEPRFYRHILSLLLLIAGLFVLASLVTFDAGDAPSTHVYPNHEPARNICGTVGAWTAFMLWHYVGAGAFLLAAGVTILAVLLLAGRWAGRIWQRGFGVMLLAAALSSVLHLLFGIKGSSMTFGGGGLLGYSAGELLLETFNWWSWPILLYVVLVGLAFAGEGVSVPWAAIGGRLADAIGGLKDRVPRPTLATVLSAASRANARAAEPSSGPKINRPVRQRQLFEDDGVEPEIDDAGRGKRGKKSKSPARGDASEDEDDATAPTGKRKSGKAGRSDRGQESGKSESKKEPGEEKTNVILRVPQPPPNEAEELHAYPRMLEDWEFPSLTLLDEPEYNFSAAQESYVREKAAILERTLSEFRLEAKVVEIDTGPVITMYELKLAAGIKVSQIAALANDIARALKAPAVRVVAPIPGKNTIGIEVPNIDKEKVRLKELMTLAAKKSQAMNLPIYLGKDASGQAMVEDLTRMPHMLIAGTTGSGKSVCINTIIMSVLMVKRPDQAKLILIDPKMVEMSQYKDVPHLMCPIVTDMQRAEQILEWAVTKMDERYEMIAEAGVRNVASYNKMTPDEIYARFQPANEEEKSIIPTHMPYIVIIIDELADLMMTSAKEVEHYLARLAQKSRAVGIHIIVATQRPEAKVVTGLIKSNLPCRVAFRVASRMDSRIVLDQNGAEVLMGQGDMLYLPPGQHKLARAQGTLIEDRELNDVIEHLRGQGKPEYHPELVKMHKRTGLSAAERDPLFDDAVEVVLQSKRGSVSLLQRRLTIGYSRASRLIEQMAAAGIVGEYKGSQAREVMVTAEEWAGIRAQMEDDLSQGYAADEEDFGEVIEEDPPFDVDDEADTDEDENEDTDIDDENDESEEGAEGEYEDDEEDETEDADGEYEEEGEEQDDEADVGRYL
jgi:S-DNA-T family DNA segregation ATPase FtsK/SpoIIIE